MRRLITAAAVSALICALFAVPSTTAIAGVQAPPVCVDDVQEPSGTFMSGNVRLKCAITNPGVIGANFKKYNDGKTYMFVTAVSGLHVYDVSKAGDPQPVASMALPHFENEDVDLGGNILMISNDAAESTGLLYLINISDPTNPVPAYNPPIPVTHYPFDMGGNPVTGGPGHTASCVNNCDFAWITNGGGLNVYDLRGAQDGEGAPQLMGTFTPPTGGIAMHDVQKDANGLYWVAGFDGTAAYRVPNSDNYDNVNDADLIVRTDADGESTYIEELGLGDGSKPNDYIHHNSRRLKDSDVLYVTEEDYTRPGCRGAGSFQTWKIPLKANGQPNSEKDAKFMDQWQTELLADAANAAGVCSAHYFDVAQKLVAQGWYEQGTRFLDVSDPKNIKQVGFYVPPRTMTWASYYLPTDKTKTIVYTFDALRGIDVLKIDRSSKNVKTAPVRNAWIFEPDLKNSLGFRNPNGDFGWACRLNSAEVVWPLP